MSWLHSFHMQIHSTDRWSDPLHIDGTVMNLFTLRSLKPVLDTSKIFFL